MSFVGIGLLCLLFRGSLFGDSTEIYLLSRQIKVGDPSDSSNMMGALVSREHLAKVMGYVELAREEGCSVLCGHGVDTLKLPEKNRNGYFMRPTVITDVSDRSRIMQEEVFGPVTCIVPFKTEEEVTMIVQCSPQAL